MKCFHLLLIGAAILPFTACEKHPVADLALIGVSAVQPGEKPAKQGVEPGKAPVESGTGKQFFPDSK